MGTLSRGGSKESFEDSQGEELTPGELRPEPKGCMDKSGQERLSRQLAGREAKGGEGRKERKWGGVVAPPQQPGGAKTQGTWYC